MAALGVAGIEIYCISRGLPSYRPMLPQNTHQTCALNQVPVRCPCRNRKLAATLVSEVCNPRVTWACCLQSTVCYRLRTASVASCGVSGRPERVYGSAYWSLRESGGVDPYNNLHIIPMYTPLIIPILIPPSPLSTSKSGSGFPVLALDLHIQSNANSEPQRLGQKI